MTGRTDLPLAAENLNYNPNALVTQSQLFAAAVNSQQAMGNTVSTVTITLGFNELGALSALSPAQALAAIPQTLANYQTTCGTVLSQVRTLLPNANLSLLGYFNPFPADPTSPAAPIFNAGGMQLNAIIRGLAAQYGASFVDTATPFIGREAAYTYLDEMPHGSVVGGAFGGTLPIGNVHPNALGYAAIAAAVSAVPEPAAWASMLGGLVGIGLLRWVRKTRAVAAA